MAQLVEQRIRNAWVAGSSPAIGSLSKQKESGYNHSGSFFFPDSSGIPKLSGISSVGRALASQAEGRGFESRIPLLYPPENRAGTRKNSKKVKKVTQKFAGFKK